MTATDEHREKDEERRKEERKESRKAERKENRKELAEDAGEAGDAAEQGQAIVAELTDRFLHIAEDLIYAVTGLLLVAGALVVLVQAIYKFGSEISNGVLKAVEFSIGSLLIVFILVELLSAVRTIITERKLVAEPFLIVGILAAIKEMVTVATFKIEEQKVSDVSIKIGVLAAVVIGLAVAVLLLRRGRGTSQTKDQQEEPAPA